MPAIAAGAGPVEQRQKQLESDLRACGYVLILGAGEPGTNDSPAERSVLVLGMERGEAEGFGRKYEQNAIIFGTEKGFPELLWIQ